MTVYWPSNTFVPMSATFRVQPISVQSRSPYSGVQKAINLAQVWVINATFNAREILDAFAFQAFLESLDGPATPIRMFDWWRTVPQLIAAAAVQPWSDGTFFSDGTGWGSMAIAPTIKYAYPRGVQTVVVKNLPASAAALKPGDLFQLNFAGADGVPSHSLHVVTRPVTADAAGEASLYFKPGLRSAAVAGDALSLFEPRGLFRMSSEPEAINRMFHWGEPFSLTFTEDVP